MKCRHCNKEIARIPEWPLREGGWHHVQRTDNSDGRYAIDCEPFDGYEGEPEESQGTKTIISA